MPALTFCERLVLQFNIDLDILYIHLQAVCEQTHKSNVQLADVELDELQGSILHAFVEDLEKHC